MFFYKDDDNAKSEVIYFTYILTISMHYFNFKYIVPIIQFLKLLTR